MKATEWRSRISELTRPGPVALGLVFALGAAIAYGTAQVLTRQVVTGMAPPLVTSFFSLLFGGLVLGAMFSREISHDIKAPRRGILLIAIAGVLSSSGVVFLYLGLGQAPVVVVSPVASLTPIFALLFTHFFLKRLERVTLRIILGTLLVVLGVVLVIVGQAFT